MKKKLFIVLACLVCALQGMANNYLTISAESTGNGKESISYLYDPDNVGGLSYSFNAPSDSEWEKATDKASFTVGNENWVLSGAVYYRVYVKPAEGYRFVGWARSKDGDIFSTNVPYAVDRQEVESFNFIDKHCTEYLYAKFEPILYVWNGNSKRETKNARELNEWRQDKETSANLMAYALVNESMNGVNDLVNVMYKNGGNYTCGDFILTDKENYYSPYDFIALRARYTREMTTEWATLCLPFPINGWLDVEMYKVVGAKGNELLVERCTSLPASTPALIKKAEGYSYDVIEVRAKDVWVKNSINNVSGPISMTGTYTTLKDQTGKYILAQDQFWLADSPVTISPFRAYFEKATGSNAKTFNIKIAGEETVIENVCLDGQENGKFVENGRVVIMKDGVKYSTTGNRIK